MFEIRGYESNDYDAARALWVELTDHHRAIYEAPGIGGDDPGAGFDDYLSMPSRVATWVAVADDEIVGMSGLLVTGKEGEIEPVVVSASHRGRGVGTALVTEVLDSASAHGLRSVSVRPVARNIDAVQFFHDVGFVTLGHIEMFLELGETGRQWRPDISFHDRQWRT